MLAELVFGERRAATLESWTGSLDSAPDELWDALIGDGGPSDAGESVTQKSALGNDAWWRGINLVSGDLSSAPRHVYKRMPDGGRERDTSHPAEYLMDVMPNPQMKAIDFFKTIQAHAMSKGNGYAYIVRRGDGFPSELWPMAPTSTTPIRVNGQLFYSHTVDGVTYTLPHWDVLHIKGLGYDGLVGYDVLTYARNSLGLAAAQLKHASFFFKQGTMPGIIVKHPGDLSEKAKTNIKAGLAKMLEGISNHHRVAVLDEAMDAVVLNLDARKAQLLEGRKFSVREVANFLGIPPHKLGDDSRISYNSLEAEDKAYLQQALNPWFCQWEAELAVKLLSDPQLRRGTHYIEFTREAVVSVDYNTKVNGLVALVNNGLKNVDEARAVFNDPALPNGEGKKFRMPANLTIIGEKLDPDPTPPAATKPMMEDVPDEMTEGQRAALRQVAADIFRRVARQMGGRAKRMAGDPAKFQSKVLGTEWDGEYVQEISTALAPVLVALGTQADRAEGDAVQFAHRFVTQWKSRVGQAAEAETNAGKLEIELPAQMAKELQHGTAIQQSA